MTASFKKMFGKRDNKAKWFWSSLNAMMFCSGVKARQFNNASFVAALKNHFGFDLDMNGDVEAQIVAAQIHLSGMSRIERRNRQADFKAAWNRGDYADKKPVKLVQPRAPRVTSSRSDKDDFYRSWDWRKLRMEVLNEHGFRCQCCGADKSHVDISGAPVRIVVDHIIPLAKRWDLRLTKSNLQVLCDECNQGKGAWDETDHRPRLAVLMGERIA